MRPRDHVGIGIECRLGRVPGLGSDHDRLAQERRAARAGGELGGELPVDQVERTLADQAAGGGIPEGGRAAVAERHLVAVGNVEQLAQAVTDPGHQLLDGLLAVRGPDHRGARARQVLELLGAHSRGAGTEPPVGRLQRCGNLENGRAPVSRLGVGTTV